MAQEAKVIYIIYFLVPSSEQFALNFLILES